MDSGIVALKKVYSSRIHVSKKIFSAMGVIFTITVRKDNEIT